MATAGRQGRALTGLYQFMAAKREELLAQEGGTDPRSLTMGEMLPLWKALPDNERREWEDKASEEQKRYLQECTERVAAGASASAAGDGDEPSVSGLEDLPVQLPLARVTKIIRLNKEVMKAGRDACYLITKATESFLERSTWEAARVTTRQHRKTIFVKDIVTSMREHPNPESMQVFIEEFQPKPDPPLEAPKKKKAAAKKRPAPAAAAGDAAEGNAAAAKVAKTA